MTRISVAMYRLLLLAFPPDFRRRHGAAMLAQFTAQQRGLRGRPVARIVHWLRAAIDAARHGLAERRDARHARARVEMNPRGGTSLHSIWQDIRFGVRLLRRQPGFTAVAVLTLALGIGAVTALASVVDSALLRPLPFPEPDRLVQLSFAYPGRNGEARTSETALTDLRFWQEHSRSFSSLAMYRGGGYLIVQSDPAQRIRSREVSEDYFRLVGATPVLGRDLQVTDTRDDAPAVAILGHGFWQRSFAGDARVIGTTLRLASGAVTIVGVAPSGFYPDVDLWRPVQVEAFGMVRGVGLRTIARLAPDVSIAEAQAELSGLVIPVDARLRDSYEKYRPLVTSLYDVTTANYRTNVALLAGAVGLIVLIACVNMAGLLLARGSGRRGELAVRAAIGAGRRRLVRQLLTESVVLSAAGGALGVGTAWLWLGGLVALMPMTVPSEAPVALNTTVLVASAVASVAIGLLFGTVPALTLSRSGMQDALARTGRRHGSALSTRGGQALIAAEVALAVVLVAGAGLMLRSLDKLMQVDLGFDPARVFVVDAVPVEPADNGRYYLALLERVRALPGVVDAGGINHIPLMGGRMGTSGRLDGGESTGVQVRTAMPGYFEAMDLRLIEGRLPGKTSEPEPWVILSETAARDLSPEGSAIGRSLEVMRAHYRVIGVVSGVRQAGPEQPLPPGLYLPFDADTADTMSIVFRTSRGAVVTTNEMRRLATGVGPPVLFEGVRSGNDLRTELLVTPRKRTGLLSLLGGLGLLLALVGLFGVTAFSVTRRTREIGIRMAFGARPEQVVRRIVLDSALPAALGIAAGLGLTLLLTRAIESYLFETTPTDPVTLAGVSVLLGVCCCLAAWVPGRRAARIDPSEALRVQ